MRDSVKALVVTLSLAGAACGSSGGGKDLAKFTGVWGQPTGTFVETCPGNPAGGGTSQVTGSETWSMGSTSDLVQTIAKLNNCAFHADVSANTATGTPAGQMCTVQTSLANGDSLTAVLTFTTYNFVVSPDGLTAMENFSGSEMDTDNTTLQTGTCSFTQSASYTKQ
jgi:hypothetical protein